MTKKKWAILHISEGSYVLEYELNLYLSREALYLFNGWSESDELDFFRPIGDIAVITKETKPSLSDFKSEHFDEDAVFRELLVDCPFLTKEELEVVEYLYD